MRAAVIFLTLAVLTGIPALLLPGFNGFSLLATLLVVLAVGFAVGADVRASDVEHAQHEAAMREALR